MVKISRRRCILAATILAGISATFGNAHHMSAANAATSGLTMAATIQPSMTLTISNDNPTLTVTPSSTGTFGSASVTVGAYSNGSIGYTLTMAASSTTLNGRGTNTIPTLTSAASCTGDETCTSSSFAPGHWGIAIDSGAYSPASTSTTELLTVANTTSSVASNTKTIRLGANLDLTTPIDEYTTVINFALVSSSIAQYDVTFNYDSHFTSFALEDASGNTVTPNPDGVGNNTKTYTLDYAGTYTVAGGYVTRYEFGVMSLSSGSGFINGNTYTVGGTSTVTVTSQKGPLVCNPAGTTIGTNTSDDIVCMQDINSANRSAILGSMTAEAEHILYDSRDDKQYWIAKLADGHVWMTQNLDLCIGCAGTSDLTSENTDLNEYGSNGYDSSNGYSCSNEAADCEGGVITWAPERATIAKDDLDNETWQIDHNNPYSYRYGDTALDKTNAYEGHKYAGTYYNWSAAIASNNSAAFSTSTLDDISLNPQNSVCPKGWRLPTIANNTTYPGTEPNSPNEFRRLNVLYNNNATDNATNLMNAPLYFSRSGYVGDGSVSGSGHSAYYWSSTVHNSNDAYRLIFHATYVNPESNRSRIYGFSVRCVAK